jgi:hypothetical protein
MKRNIIIEGCVGCKLYHSSEYICLITDDMLEECPCLVCLLKGMCGQSCEDYKTAVKRVKNAMQ